MSGLFCFLYKYYMKLHEAQQILHDNGFLVENNQTYHFDIEWNTGDMYWDNFPIYDEFDGTLEELNKYLNSKLHKEDVPANLTEDDLKEMLAGETVYDETGEVFSVKI